MNTSSSPTSALPVPSVDNSPAVFRRVELVDGGMSFEYFGWVATGDAARIIAALNKTAPAGVLFLLSERM